MGSACLRSCVQLDEFRMEIQRRDQEILAMGAKMKTLEEQHQDYQRHIAVLKESLCAKEEHYNMLQADVEELRQRLEEKNRHIEKKTQQFQQDRTRATAEITEMREHMDIKDRKINVLQRKVIMVPCSVFSNRTWKDIEIFHRILFPLRPVTFTRRVLALLRQYLR